MRNNDFFGAPRSGFIAAPVYLAIFILGLQYARYKIYSKFKFYDDEGSGMLLVRAFLEDTASYDSLGGYHGPFYYLVRYAIYSLLNIDVSHDITRLTTIALWGLIALVCAFFVHRVTRSLVLAAIVQMQMILNLSPLTDSPGHPQDMVLLLLVTVLFLSSFVGSQRYGQLSMAGMGAALGALIMTKINVGAYLGIPLALSMLLFLPRSLLKRGLLWLVSVVALLLPIALMWRHALTPSVDQNYCITATLIIASCLVAASRKSENEVLNWSNVGIAVGAMVISIACICGLIIAGGGTIYGIADTVLLRAFSLSSQVHIPTSMSQNSVYTSIASLLLALCYRFLAQKIRNRDTRLLVLSGIKLVCGCIVLASIFPYAGTFTIVFPYSIQFIWIVLIDPDEDAKSPLSKRFPRALLCFLAAFQVLQAYPVAGAQQAWAVIFLIPLAVLCIGDALPVLWARIKQRWPDTFPSNAPPWQPPVLTLLALIYAGMFYYHRANIVGLGYEYWPRAPLNLPGASLVRLETRDFEEIHGLVQGINSHCDGFVGLPGMPSLYFWTGIQPPAIISGYWPVDLKAARQEEIIETMETYQQPCVVYSRKWEETWNSGRRADSERPLVDYIHTQFKELKDYGEYSLMIKSDRVIPAHDNRAEKQRDISG